jgi:hypothetical protein
MRNPITLKWTHWIGLIIILMASLGLVAVEAQASPAPQPAATTSADGCADCHEWVEDHWLTSAHSDAATDEIFTQAWAEKGNPPEGMQCHATGYDAQTQTWEEPGVTCVACHSPVTENHPEEVMPTNPSSRLCGTCHIDTFAEFEESVHSTSNLSCNQCHAAHSTSLKIDQSEELCKACHRDAVHSFEQTVHASSNLTCTDCHVQISNTELGEGHGKRVHTFEVDLQTCTMCHGDGTHTEVSVGDLSADFHNLEGQNLCEDSLAQHSLQTQPDTANPLSYVLIASLFGLAMVAGPLLERWSRRKKQ